MDSPSPSASDLVLDFKLYPQQDDFVRCDRRYVGFIGGAGSGKTYAGCVKALLKALNNPGSAGAIVAPWYNMLRDVTKKTFLDLIPPAFIVYRNDTENRIGIRCQNGQVSDVFFRNASEPDALRGLNLVWAYMDEASLSPFDSYQILIQRIRAGNPDQQQIWITTTPKGRRNWVFERFGHHITNPQYKAFYAETKFNPFLGDQYISDVYSQFQGSFAQQELEGKFVDAEGLIYGDLYDPKVHMGDHPFQPDLPVDLAWDFGFNNPEGVLAIQQDGQGNVYVIDELYRRGVLTEVIVAEGRAKPWWRNVVDCVCDDASPASIARLQELGVPARPSHKGKVQEGINRVRSLLALDKATQKPIFHLDRRCVELDREFGMYRWADKNTMTDVFRDTPTKAFDHLLDALRYWVCAKWSSPSLAIPDDYRHKKPKKRIMSYQLMRTR